jgi:hypothetical protein
MIGPGQGAYKYTSQADSRGVLGATSAILQEDYLPAVREQLNNQRILSAVIQRNSEDIDTSGKYAVMNLHTGRNEGIGFIGEYGNLPDPGVQGYQNAQWRMRYFYGRGQVTGPAVQSSTANSFVRVLDSEMRQIATDMQHECNRVLFGNGSGALARVSSAAAAASGILSVDRPGGFESTAPGTKYLRPDMRIVIVDTTSGDVTQDASQSVFFITSVDYAANTITVSQTKGGSAADLTAGANDPASGDFIYRASSTDDVPALGTAYASTGLENEPFGIAAIIGEGNPGGTSAGNFGQNGFLTSTLIAGSDNGLFGEIDADSVGVWNSAVLDNSGTPRAFSQDLLQRGEDMVAQVAGTQINMLMTTYGIRRQYLNDLVAAKRYPSTMSLDGGWNVLEYNGRPLVVDKDCTNGRVYGIDTTALHMFTGTDFNFMDADGSVLSRAENRDAYQFTLYRYFQFGAEARNRHFVITDIQD